MSCIMSLYEYMHMLVPFNSLLLVPAKCRDTCYMHIQTVIMHIP